MNKKIERIASLIMALAMIVGNTIHAKAAGSATALGTSSAPSTMFAQANSILAGDAARQFSSPALLAPGIGMWMSGDEIMRLPTSGTAWTTMKNVATGSWGTADLKDQDNRHAINVLAGALVAVRTDNASLRQKVSDGILAAKRSMDESSEWQTTNGVLAASRQIGAYVVAADLINLANFNATADSEFRTWLSMIRTTTIGTHGRWTAISYTCENATSNWATFACASRIAASIYLGDTADVDRSASIIRALVGERSSYPANAPGSNGYFEHTAGYNASWACADTTWMGINPGCIKSDVNIDGVLVEDASRGGGCCILQGDGVMYSWEALQGLFFSTELLYRTGRYGNPYDWSNQALKRSLEFMKRSGWQITNVASFVPWLANKRYGTTYAQPAKYTGRIMGWGYWLYQR